MLQAVDVPFTSFFGASTAEAYQSMTSLDEVATQNADPSTSAPTSTDSGSSGVSSGAAAGIGIGCAVAGILIGAVAMSLFAKRKAAWQPHSDAGAPVMNGGRAGSESYKL